MKNLARVSSEQRIKALEKSEHILRKLLVLQEELREGLYQPPTYNSFTETLTFSNSIEKNISSIVDIEVGKLISYVEGEKKECFVLNN